MPSAPTVDGRLICACNCAYDLSRRSRNQISAGVRRSTTGFSSLFRLKVCKNSVFNKLEIFLAIARPSRRNGESC